MRQKEISQMLCGKEKQGYDRLLKMTRVLIMHLNIRRQLDHKKEAE